VGGEPVSETFLFDDVDIQSIDGVYIADWAGQFAIPELRGNDVVKPSVHGATGVARPFGTSVFTIPIELVTDSLAERNDALNALVALIQPGQVVKCTRRRTYGTGDANHDAAVRYLSGFDPSWIDTGAARLALSFENLDAFWYAPITSPTIPGTITVGGNTRTNKITLVLPSAGTLTNTTLGVAVAVTAGQTLACGPRTTNGSLAQVSASGDPLGNWFALEPGSNTITWSGSGTPTISYQAAYL
jgi:hypothetical protein